MKNGTFPQTSYFVKCYNKRKILSLINELLKLEINL